MVCGNFILPEPASYVFFYAFSNLRNLLYIIRCPYPKVKAERTGDELDRLRRINKTDSAENK